MHWFSYLALALSYASLGKSSFDTSLNKTEGCGNRRRCSGESNNPVRVPGETSQFIRRPIESYIAFKSILVVSNIALQRVW